MKPEHLENVDDFFHHFSTVWRRKWIVIASILLCLCVAIYHNSGLKPSYQASVTMLIDKETIKSPLSGEGKGFQYESWFSETMSFNTHFKLITSREVMERASKLLDGDLSYYENQSGASFDQPGLYKLIANAKETMGENLQLLFGDDRGEEKPLPEDVDAPIAGLLSSIITIEPVENTRLLNLIAKHHNPYLAQEWYADGGSVPV